MTAATRTRTSGGEGFTLKGWHVWTMLGVFFGTVIGVNALFITLAMNTFPGEDVRRSYVQGLNYNDTLEARARQARLGWQASARFEATASGPTLLVRMTSADGAPLTGMAITGALRRAATDREDITLAFVETQAGEYRARLEGLGKGGWVLRGEAARGADRFELTGRLAW